MAWKTVKDDATKFENAGQSLEGLYNGFTEHTSSLTGKENRLYELLNDGDAFHFWSTTVLDRRMAQIKQGDYIRVTYLGKKGEPPRVYKDFAIEVDESRSKAGDVVAFERETGS